MPLLKGTKVERGYATVDEDGVNYRSISDTMTEMGFKINHSSARNYVLRSMRKFAEAFSRHMDIPLKDEKLEDVVRSPNFQSFMADILHRLEVERRQVEEFK